MPLERFTLALIPARFAPYGFEIIFSEATGAGWRLGLANGLSSLWFDYDVRESWLGLLALTDQKGREAASAWESQPGVAAMLLEFAVPLRRLLNERSSGAVPKLGIVERSEEAIGETVGRLIKDMERYCPELLAKPKP